MIRRWFYVIKSVLVIFRSGLLVAKWGAKEEEISPEVLSSLISIVIDASEKIKSGGAKSVTFGDSKLIILKGIYNPDLFLIAHVDREDIATRILLRQILLKIEFLVPSETDVVTDEMQKMVLDILNQTLLKKPELPSITDIINISKIVYGNLPSQLILSIEEEYNQFMEQEKEDEKKKVYTPKKMKFRDINDALRSLEKSILNYSLYDVYDIANSLLDFEEYKNIARLIGFKAGLLIRMNPPESSVPSLNSLRDLIDKVEPETSLIENIKTYLQYELQSVIDGEMRGLIDFIRNKDFNISRDLMEENNPRIRKFLAFSLFTQYYEIIQTAVWNTIYRTFALTDSMFEKLLICLRSLSDLRLITYTPKEWEEIESLFSDYKLSYLKSKRKLREYISKKGILEKVIQPVLQSITGKNEKAIELTFDLMCSIRPYLLALITAIETYGLSLRDIKVMMEEAYNTTLEDIETILSTMPMVDHRAYLDFFQLILHLMLYYQLIVKEDKREEILDKAKEIAEKGIRLFTSLYFRDRISEYTYIRSLSPLVYVLSRFSLHKKELSKELIWFVGRIAEISEKGRAIIMSKDVYELFSLLSNIITILYTVAHFIKLPRVKKDIINGVGKLLDQLVEWMIYNGRLTREAIVNYKSFIEVAIHGGIERDKALSFIKNLDNLASVLIQDPYLNKFETFLIYRDIIEISNLFTTKYGNDEFIDDLIADKKEILIRVLEEEGLKNFEII